MWFVLLIPLTVAAVTDTTDRQTRTLPLPEGRALSIEVTVGSVRLSERPADARIMALALNGSIVSAIPLTMKDTWGPRWGEATFGAGEPVISLDVITGTIEIRSP